MTQLAGVPEFKAALEALPAKVERRVLRKSAIAGARVVRDQVRSLAPIAAAAINRGHGVVTTPGTLRRAVVLKFAAERSTKDSATYVVAIRRGKGEQKNNRDAFYWTFVERGHKVIGRSGRQIGTAPAHPFFVPAYRATSQAALDAMQQAMATEMTAILAEPISQG